MQNLENFDVFEILITQNLLKCLKDRFVRSTNIDSTVILSPLLPQLEQLYVSCERVGTRL